MNEVNKVLKSLVHDGIVIDIFNAEQAYGIDDVFGLNAEKINGATYGNFFGPVQQFLVDSIVLTIAKLFELPNSRYQICSIPSAIKFLKESSGDLEIVDRKYLVEWLVSKEHDRENLADQSDSQLTMLVVEYFQSRIPNPKGDSAVELDRALHAIKINRDKRISHNEIVSREALPRPTYQQLFELLELAKEFVVAVGRPYFSMLYEDDGGRFFLSTDSGKSSRCLMRILSRLEVIEQDHRVAGGSQDHISC